MGRRLASLVKGLQIQHRENTWKLVNRLGAGGFAEVWEVTTESRKKVLSLSSWSRIIWHRCGGLTRHWACVKCSLPRLDHLHLPNLTKLSQHCWLRTMEIAPRPACMITLLCNEDCISAPIYGSAGRLMHIALHSELPICQRDKTKCWGLLTRLHRGSCVVHPNAYASCNKGSCLCAVRKSTQRSRHNLWHGPLCMHECKSGDVQDLRIVQHCMLITEQHWVALSYVKDRWGHKQFCLLSFKGLLWGDR